MPALIGVPIEASTCLGAHEHHAARQAHALRRTAGTMLQQFHAKPVRPHHDGQLQVTLAASGADRQPGMTKARRVWCHRGDSACEEDNRQDCPLATRQSGFLRASVGPPEPPPGLTGSYRTGRARGLDRSTLAIATCGRAVVLYKLIQVNRLRTRTVKLPVVCSGRHSACGQS